MLRREFIALLGGAAMWPSGAYAQAPVKIARIGFLGLAPASAWSDEIGVLFAAAHESGLAPNGLRQMSVRVSDRRGIRLKAASGPAP
jgi:hypothetical protein